MENQKIPEKTFRELVYVLFRHRKSALYFFSFVMTATLIITFVMGKVYRSEAKILVKLGRENVTLDPTVTMGEFVSVNMDRDSEVNSEIEILNSSELAEKVVDVIGPNTIKYGYPGPASAMDTITSSIKSILLFPIRILSEFVDYLRNMGVPDSVQQEQYRAQIVQDFRKVLKIKPVKKSSVIALSYDSKDPQVAHDVLTNLINYYVEKHVNVFRTQGTQKFFDQQKEDLGKELLTIEKRIRNYKNETGFASLEEQMKIHLQNIGELQRQIQITESELVASNAKIESLEGTLNNLPAELITEKITGIPFSSKQELRKQLNDLKLSEQELLATFKEQSPPVLEIRRQIEEAEGLLLQEDDKDQVTRGINVSHQQIELALMTEEGLNSALLAKAESLKKQLAKEEKKLKVLNETEIVMSDLERRKKISENSFIKYSESLEEARIDDQLKKDKISNISIIQPATLPVKHVFPKRTLNILLGLLVGLAGGVVLTFFLEYMDHTFKKPADIAERLNLPLLASVPLFDNEKIITPDIISIKNLIKIPEPLDEAFEMKNSKKEEFNDDSHKYFEHLLHSLLFSYKGDSLSTTRVFGITSCYSGEGVTTVANNLAANLTRIAQGPVLLIDMKQLKNKDKNVYNTPYPNLGNILALRKGSSTPKLPDRIDTLYLLHSSTLAKQIGIDDILSVWKKDYEFVVVDLPPLNNDPGVIALAHLAEEIIWVIEAEETRWEVAQQQKEHMLKSGVNFAGVVLNKRKFYIPEWLYKRIT